jgi:hypothetical protein
MKFETVPLGSLQLGGTVELQCATIYPAKIFFVKEIPLFRKQPFVFIKRHSRFWTRTMPGRQPAAREGEPTIPNPEPNPKPFF